MNDTLKGGLLEQAVVQIVELEKALRVRGVILMAEEKRTAELEDALRDSLRLVDPCAPGCSGCAYCRGQELLEKS